MLSFRTLLGRLGLWHRLLTITPKPCSTLPPTHPYHPTNPQHLRQIEQRTTMMLPCLRMSAANSSKPEATKSRQGSTWQGNVSWSGTASKRAQPPSAADRRWTPDSHLLSAAYPTSSTSTASSSQTTERAPAVAMEAPSSPDACAAHACAAPPVLRVEGPNRAGNRAAMHGRPPSSSALTLRAEVWTCAASMG